VDNYSIVFVCTGNRFRSPLAEAFVRQLTVDLPVTTQSLGTLELEDAPALPEALEIGLLCGLDLSGHLTRSVGHASLDQVDLVLGFDETHVRQAVVDAHTPRGRAFTLRGIARLLAAVEVSPHNDVILRARHALPQLEEVRAAEPESRGRDDMPDPFGRSWNVYRETAVEIRELSMLLVETLFGITDPSGLPPVPTRRARDRRSLWPRQRD
jgi:protein-tyrosine phosphatase